MAEKVERERCPNAPIYADYNTIQTHEFRARTDYDYETMKFRGHTYYCIWCLKEVEP